MATEAPRLCDEDDGGVDFFEGGFDGAEGLYADEFGEVEAEAVHSVKGEEVGEAVDHEAASHGGIAAEVVPAAAPVHVGAVRGEFEPVVFIEILEVVGLADVVVNDVENNGDALFVEGIDEFAEIGEAGGVCGVSRVVGIGGEEVTRHVAPVVFFAVFGVVLLDRLKLDGVDAEFF